MAITRYAGDRFTIAAGDTKPTGVLDGAVLIDTGNLELFIKRDGSWVEVTGAGSDTVPGDPLNSVQFNNNGAFGGNTNLTFTDAVGIGNTDPKRLNVNQLGISGKIYDSNNWIGEGGMILANEGTTGVNWKNIESVLSGVGGSGVANYVARWSDEDTLTTGALVDDGTKVGIGTPTPDDILDVTTTNGQLLASDYGVLKLIRGTAGDYGSALQFIKSDNGGAVTDGAILGSVRFFGHDGIDTATEGAQIASIINGTPSANVNPTDIVFKTASTGNDDLAEKVRIMSNGKVGIGTTAPGAILDARGDTHIGSVSIPSTGSRLYVDGPNASRSNLAHFYNNDMGHNSNVNIWIGKQSAADKAFSLGYHYDNTAAARYAWIIHYGDSPGAGMNWLKGGKVGIGTVAPAAKLDVIAHSAESWEAIRASGSVKYYTSTSDGSELRYAFNMGGASDGAYQYLYKGDASTIGISLNAGGATYFNGGSVGIGNAAPVELLHVGKGESSVHGQILISADSGLHHYLRLTNGGGTSTHYPTGIWYAPSGRMELRAASGASTSNVAQLVLAADGNVGIGTTTPSMTLEVAGQMLLKSSSPEFDWVDTGAASNEGRWRADVNNSGTWALKSTNDAVSDSNDAISITRSGYVPQYVNFPNGKVGIGTDAPSKLLTVNPSTAGDGIYLLESDSANPCMQFYAYSNYGIFTMYERGDPQNTISTKLDGGGGGVVFNEKGYAFDFRIEGDTDQNLFFLDGSTDKIGIGTNAPLAKLHVREANAGSFTYDGTADTLIVESNANGGITIATAAANTGRIIFASPNDPTGAEIKYSDATSLMTIGTTTPNDHLVLQAGNGVEAMRIDSSGNVGIGTTAPGSVRLNVLTTVSGNLAAQFENSHSTGSYGVVIKAGSDSSNYSLDVRSKGNTTLMRVRGDGYVGIGTNAPEGKLHIENASSGASYTPDGGDILIVENSDSALIDIRTPAANAGGIMFSDTVRSRGGIFYYHEFDQMNFATGGTNPQMIITSDGTLDIKSAKLKINGSGGSAGQTLTTDGSGNISWSAAGSGTISGSGTDNYIPRFNGTSAIENSTITDDGTTVTVGGLITSTGNSNGRVTNWKANSAGWAVNVFKTNGGVDKWAHGINSSNEYYLYNYATSSTDFIVNADGNVGIGTTAPADVLHVYGPGNVALFESSSANSWLKIKGSTTYSWQIGSTDKGLQFYNDETSAYRVVFKKDGNVGIGTVTPTALLHLNFATGGYAKIGYATDKWGGFQFVENGATKAYVDYGAYNTTDGFTFYAGGGGSADIAMKIKEGGGVIIAGGAAEPGTSTKLQVAGRGLFTGGTHDPGDGSPKGLSLTFENNVGVIRAVHTAVVSYDIAIQPTSGGNVGIGTTVPAGRLDIIGSNGTVSGTPDGDAEELVIRNNDRAGIQILSAQTTGKWGSLIFGSISDINGANIFYEPYTKLLRIGTQVASGQVAFRAANGAEAMRIDASGKVGIGTTAPSRTLTIDDDSLACLQLCNATTGPAASDGFQMQLASSTGYLWNYDGDIAIGGGNVGIGNAAPSQKLEVSAPGNGDGIKIQSTGGAVNRAPALHLNPLSTSANERNWSISPYRDHPESLSFASSNAKGGDGYSAATTRFIINGISGNVGIGIVAPVANLHIYEATTDTPLQITRAANTGNAMIKFETGTTDDWIVGLRNDSTSDFRFYSYGTSSDALTIKRADGNVGIGTTNPGSYKLYVNGTTYVSGQMSAALGHFQNSSHTIVTIKAHTSGDKYSMLQMTSNGTQDNYIRADVGDLIIDGSHSSVNVTKALAVTGALTGSRGVFSAASGTNYALHIKNTTAASPYTCWIEEPASPTAGYPLLNVTSSGGTNNYFRIDSGTGTSFFGGQVKVEKSSGLASLTLLSNPANQVADIGGEIIFQATYRATSDTTPVARIKGSRENATTNNWAGKLTFHTSPGGDSPSASTEQMRIQSDGKVGIGITNPSTLLEVSGIATAGTFRATGKLVSADNIFMAAGQFYLGAENSSTNDTYRMYHSSGSFLLQSRESGTWTTRFDIGTSGAIKFNAYGSGTHTGTAAYKLSVDSSGNIIETAIGAGAVDGSGTTNYISKWTDSDTLGNSNIFDNGTTVGISTTTGFIGRDLAVAGVGMELGRFVANTNGPVIDFIKSRNATIGSNTIVQNGDILGDLIFRGADGSDFLTIGSRIQSKASTAGGGTIAANKIPADLVFSTAAGGSADDIGEKMRITSDGKVGIGTAGPAGKLSVITTSDTNGTPTAYDDKYFIVGAGGTTGGNVFISYDQTNNKGYIGALSPSVAWRDLILQPGGGNVGIGTTAPGAPLEVVGGSTNNNDTANVLALTGSEHVRAIIDTSSTGGHQASLVLESNSNEVSIATTGSNEMRFNAGGSERVRIDSSGRVGINQTPLLNNFAFQVTGLQSNGTDARAVYFKGAGTATSIGSTGPTLTLQNTNTTVNNIVKLSFESASSGETVSLNAINTNHSSHYGDFAINTRGSAGYSEKMRVLANGNVGIGTAAPGGKLDVYSSATRYVRVHESGSLGDLQVVSDNGTMPAFAVKGTGTADLVNVWDGSTEVFTILDGGKVGIGTTAPEAKLHVKGSEGLVLQSSSGGGDERWMFDSNGYQGYLGIGFSATSTPGTPKLVIKEDGKVGIGTNAPSSLLEIGASSNTTDQLQINGPTSTTKLHMGQFSNGSYIFTNYRYRGGHTADSSTLGSAGIVISADSTSGVIAFDRAVPSATPSRTTSMVIENDGTLDLKSAKFKINGSGGTAGYHLQTDGSGNISWAAAGSGGGGTVTGTGTDNYVPRWNGTTALQNSSLFAKDDGNLGIGTPTPGSNLMVKSSGNTNISVIGGSYTAAPQITFGGDSSGNVPSSGNTGSKIVGQLAISGGQAQGSLEFWTNPGDSLQQRLTILKDGKVGIGITDPDQALEIGAAGKLKVSRADNSRSMLLYTDNSDGTIETDTDPILIKSAHRIRFSTNGANERMRITETGLVGIGIAPSFTPGGSRQLLQITNGSNGGLIALGDDSSESSNPRIFSTTSGLGLAAAGGGETWFYDGSTLNAIINSDGNFGLGTSTSLYAGTGVTSLTINATSYPTISFNIGNTISHVIMGYSTSLNIDAVGNRSINLRTNGADRLSISGAGAATFSGTLSCGGLTASTGTFTGAIAGIAANFTKTSSDAYTPTAYNNDPILTLLSPNANTEYSGIRFSNATGNYEKFLGSVQTAGATADIVFQGYDRGTTTYKEYLRIQEDGNVGIGTTAPGAYKLRVQGDVYISGTLTEASSLGIKENIETYSPSLEKINKIRPVRYNKKKSKKKEVGLVAEELAEMFPELVETDEKGNPSGVNYSRAVAVLLHGFKELYKEVKELKEKI